MASKGTGIILEVGQGWKLSVCNTSVQVPSAGNYSFLTALSSCLWLQITFLVPRDCWGEEGLCHLSGNELAAWRAEMAKRFPNFPLKSSTVGVNFVTDTLVSPPLCVNDTIRILKITNDKSSHKTTIKTSASSSSDLWKMLFWPLILIKWSWLIKVVQFFSIFEIAHAPVRPGSANAYMQI